MNLCPVFRQMSWTVTSTYLMFINCASILIFNLESRFLMHSLIIWWKGSNEVLYKPHNNNITCREMHPRVGELESVSIHKKALINNTEHHHVFITRSLFQSECDNFFILLVVLEPVLENLVPEKSLGIGIGKIWYRKNYCEFCFRILALSSHSVRRPWTSVTWAFMPIYI